MTVRRLTQALATLIFATPMAANAVLINQGNTTLSTDTNLEWLDLTLTQGISYNAALASTYVVNDGFRHATRAEVEAMFLEAGFATTNNVNNPINDPAAQLLLNLMGCTANCGTVNALGRGFAIWDANFRIRPNYHLSGLGAGAAVVSLFTSNGGLIDVTSGHYLVRDFQPVPIPSPGTLALLGLGLTVTWLARRRRHI